MSFSKGIDVAGPQMPIEKTCTTEFEQSSNEQREVASDDPERPSGTHLVVTTAGKGNNSEDVIVSCFRNEEKLSVYWRYGIPIYLITAAVLLTIANVGSGVAAETTITSDGEVFDESVLLEVSIATSIAELWSTGSYPLAIFVVMTSMVWPYAKLICGLLAWTLPIRNERRRELFIEIVDATDKWSFVDIFVFVIIMVSFRSTINAGLGVLLDVVIAPLWGFYLFILANMLSLLGTHVILYHHRRLQKLRRSEDSKSAITAADDGNDDDDDGVGQSLATSTHTNRFLLIFLLVTCMGMHLAGCLLSVYRVTSTRSTESFTEEYSIIDVGAQIPDATLDPSDPGIRWIQAMYFFLAVALPVWNSILFGGLYFLPLVKIWQERIFLLAQITFSWGCAEVMTMSIAFSVLQMPKFGNGLIDAGCSECYRVDSEILPQFAVICVSTAINVATNLWLYQRAHRFLYSHA